MSIYDSKYAPHLEDTLKAVMEHNPAAIGTCMILPDGEVLTAYFEASVQDKATMANHIFFDAMLGLAKANAKEILEAVEDEEDG